MDQFGDDLLLSIYDKVNDPDDRKSFSQVSKRFWKLSCLRRQPRLYIVFPDLLYYILPAASPKVDIFKCHKPLSNDHMKLLAQSCPQLSILDIYLDQNFDPSEPNFDDDGLCAVANACMHLSKVFLNRRLHISDVGVAYLIARLNSLISLDLSGCVNVTDESLKAIGESKCLGGLFLAGCSRITDLGLKYLAKGNVRKCLAQLTLAECDRISDNGIVI
uniref:F-box protein At3g58530-like n=1 Tax=Erigeron canadensis TaxID=72917 RepID=UPI001CB96461|nr:F-box protein At3g58530-like [Erigeron canadensis]